MMEPNQQLMYMIVMFLITLSLWDTWIVRPMHYFIAILHEIGHFMAAFLTSGNPLLMKVEKGASGMVYFQGGNTIITVNAGYFTSYLIGFLFCRIPYWEHSGLFLALFGCIYIVAGMLLIWNRFGRIVSILLGVLLVSGHMVLPVLAVNLLAMFIGVCCILSAFIEIQRCRADAQTLAEHTRIPAFFWMTFWRIASFLIFIAFVRTLYPAGS